MKSKALHLIATLLFMVAFIIIIGCYGSAEFEDITNFHFIVRASIGVLFLGVGVICINQIQKEGYFESDNYNS